MMLDPKTLTPEELYKLQSETWIQGADYERERITRVALDWISEMRGHDSDCDCEKKAEILEQFINHDEFKGKNK
jgi:hypothetical protein